MKRVELESKSAICFAKKGESVSFPINSIPGIPSAGTGQRGWIRRTLDRDTVLIYLQPCDALTGGVAVDAEMFAPLFIGERTELESVISYWRNRAEVSEKKAERPAKKANVKVKK